VTTAEELFELCKDGYEFTQGSYDVYLSNASNPAPNTFKADVVVKYRGTVIYKDDAQVVNPPLLVADLDGDIVKGGNIEINPITGEEETASIRCFRHDPAACLKTIMMGVIRR